MAPTKQRHVAGQAQARSLMVVIAPLGTTLAATRRLEQISALAHQTKRAADIHNPNTFMRLVAEQFLTSWWHLTHLFDWHT